MRAIHRHAYLSNILVLLMLGLCCLLLFLLLLHRSPEHVNASCMYSRLWQMLVDGMHMVCAYVLANVLQQQRSVVIPATAFLATK